MSVPSFKLHKVLNNALATIVKQFVNVRWQTLATVLPSTMSQQCQRCFIKVITTMSTVLPSQLQSSMCRPPFPLAQTKIDPCMFWSRRDLSGTTVTLPCLPRVTPLRKALFARGPGPSTVRPSSWANLSSFYSCSSDDDRLSSPLAPMRPSRCRCVRG